jgi:RHS repeat-associated protein
VVQSYSYDSFGTAKPSRAFVNSYTYAGREWDKETGLHYYRARYYDPMEGRFIQKDPIGFKGGINLYSYVQNNPLNYRDPFGFIGEGLSMDAHAMALLGFGRFTSWCCDGVNLWMIRGTKFYGGLGFGFMAGFSLEHGNKKNCPGGYSGASIETAIGPVSGSSSLGSDWTSTGAGPGWGLELFVISIAKIDAGFPKIVGKCCSK